MMKVGMMILAINLNDDEVDGFDLYKAIIYLWLNTDSVTQYDDMDAFRNNFKEHISDLKGNNYVGIIDTDNNHYEVANINANVTIKEMSDIS